MYSGIEFKKSRLDLRSNLEQKMVHKILFETSWTWEDKSSSYQELLLYKRKISRP